MFALQAWLHPQSPHKIGWTDMKTAVVHHYQSVDDMKNNLSHYHFGNDVTWKQHLFCVCVVSTSSCSLARIRNQVNKKDTGM